MHWFPFYSSDFLGATVGLSCLERSIYALMLPLYYEVGPFPVERIRIYRIIGCESDEQKRAVDFLLTEYFVLREDGWYQPRAEEVKARQAETHDKLSEYGRIGRQKQLATPKRKPRPGPGHPQAEPGLIQNQNQNQNQILEPKSEALAPSPQASGPSGPPAAASKAVIGIPLNDKTDYQVSAAMVAEWEGLYPECDVLQTLREIRGWNLANPTKRKTKSGVINHINRWLAKEQNRG